MFSKYIKEYDYTLEQSIYRKFLLKVCFKRTDKIGNEKCPITKTDFEKETHKSTLIFVQITLKQINVFEDNM